jgi:hypothetical protein
MLWAWIGLPLITYISMCTRMNRCYNEWGSRPNYVRSSIPHCIMSACIQRVWNLDPSRMWCHITMWSESDFFETVRWSRFHNLIWKSDHHTVSKMGTSRQEMQYHIPEERGPQLHSCTSLLRGYPRMEHQITLLLPCRGHTTLNFIALQSDLTKTASIESWALS